MSDQSLIKFERAVSSAYRADSEQSEKRMAELVAAIKSGHVFTFCGFDMVAVPLTKATLELAHEFAKENFQ